MRSALNLFFALLLATTSIVVGCKGTESDFNQQGEFIPTEEDQAAAAAGLYENLDILDPEALVVEPEEDLGPDEIEPLEEEPAEEASDPSESDLAGLHVGTSYGPIPGITSKSLYGVYYGSWSDSVVNEVIGATGKKKYDLMIVHPNTNITRSHVSRMQSAGVKVLCYLSVGEDDTLHSSYFTGGTSGPAPGYATWYFDVDNDDKPDQNSNWGSYYANPSSTNWRNALKNYTNQGGQGWYGYNYIVNTLGCNGVFLDTIDTVSPWGNPYAYKINAMINLIANVRHNMPADRLIVINRGLFYFDPSLPEITETMRDRVRRLVNGVMFENFMGEGDRDYWAGKLTTEANKSDGFTVMSLDYVNPGTATSTQIQNICNETNDKYGWLSHVSSNSLDSLVNLVRDNCFSSTTPPPPPPPPSACTYTYSSWEACQSNNTQTRTVASSSPTGCTGTPVLSQSCTYVPPSPTACTYTYSSWGSCQSNNTQTRTVTSSSPSGCTGTPVLSQSCTYVLPACTYTYSSWGTCQSNNTQTRTVTSSSPSGCTGTPVLSQSCTYVPPPPPPPSGTNGPIPGLTANSLYGVHYGSWSDSLVNEVIGATGKRKYDMVITHPKSNLTRSHVSRMQSAGVKVICYLSVGEDDTLHSGASWYYDANGDGQPDENGQWGSYYTNPSDPNWLNALKTYTNSGSQGWYGYDYMLNTLGCDGLFFDTVDTASPWGPYASKMNAMLDLIANVRSNIGSSKYLIMNRGLFYFDTSLVSTAMRDRFRQLINGVMFENYMDEGDRTYWANLMNAEADKSDGFTGITLDYASGTPSASQIQNICNASRGAYGFLPYVSNLSLSSYFHWVRDYCN